ncbi:DUF5995 family protein [Haloglomus litoreum]|uniref:DUF5995 family protein n=1 Tax=Haloglomus litoreum TaxID=3034026 RepID=UPI0023E7C625|nr:DUF5995 family protein [Haloglomus sp. DT116]
MSRARGPRRSWRKEATAVGRRLRRGRPTARRRAGGDPEILSLLAAPYGSVEEARDRLDALRREFADRGDDRAVFLTVYARTTEAVAARIERGEFEDPEWVATYLVAFANRYRQACHNYERGALSAVADPWQLAFDSAAEPDSLVAQDALLGVNAHINYDLAFALVDAGIERDRTARYADHCDVTEVLRTIVDDIQDLLASEAPGLVAVDESLGRADERLAIFTIDECRASAWRNAVGLSSRFRLRRWLARRVTGATATGAAYLLLSTRASDSVQGALGEFEAGGEDEGGQGTGVGRN